ncbi:hypothetical protein OS493_012526 [Desmophyllum pertusum]|uniref:Uncharacterized protein n=1 Tax=Desmophyllum pertusum TaxID=174260 RepID=A0A9W9ZEF4_9CNID|nr:hypothetical protein OS493_012526 [Desmophyllum pertusum]
MTELSPVCHVTPFDNIKYGSVGVLLPNLECKVVDIENGNELGLNKEGEICVKGPTVMKGDIGHYDEDEHFFIVDRLKELIKYKGFQVPPAELESLLISHSAIEDAAVIGVPDARAGELPKAFVVKKANEEITEEEIVKYIEERVAPHKTLRVEWNSSIKYQDL